MSNEPRDSDPIGSNPLAAELLDLNPLAGDPLDRDARALFAAGAREQAPARLRAALLAGGALTDLHTRAVPRPSISAQRMLPDRRRIGPALAAVAGVLAAFAVWSVRGTAPDERLLISAEQAPGAVPTAPTAIPRIEAPLTPSLPAAPSAHGKAETRPSHTRTSPSVRAATAVAAAPPAASVASDSAGAAPPAAPLPATPGQLGAGDLTRQLELMQDLQKALRAGQHRRMLELLDSPGNQLEQGEFAAEARLMRIEALAGAGRRTEAASLAREFLNLFPHSPLSDRARRFGNASPP